jgi:hypothetical protein
VPSRVATGFNRLGVVICVPFLILSVVLAGKEIIDPSGAWTVAMPTGTSAWKPDRVTAADKAIVSNSIAEQKALGISIPEGFVVVGVPLQVERQPDGSWTKFQLRDARELGIFSTDGKKVTDTATNFLWNERLQGRAYSDKDTMEFDGIRVKFLNPYDRFPPTELPWPQRRRRDWTWASSPLSSDSVFL